MESKPCGCTKPCNCKPNCPCDQDSDYIMVKATGKEAALCGPTENPTGTESCPLQEPSYDLSQSDFLVPSEGSGSFANMQVCNGSIYTLNQWLYFLSGVHLKVSGITGNILSLVNQCSPGVIVDSNPDIGFIIRKNDPFVVSDGPPCLSDSDKEDLVQEALSNMTEICAPNLVEAPQTDEIIPVGLTVDGEAGHTKCIKRIPGINIKEGAPYLTLVKAIPPADLFDWNRLLINKINKEVAMVAPYGGWAGLSDDNVYTLTVKDNQPEKLIRSDPFTIDFRSLYESSEDITDTSSWASHTGDFNRTIAIASPYARSPIAHEEIFNILVRIDFGAHATAVNQFLGISYEFDGVKTHIGYFNTASADAAVFNQMTAIIPVKRANDSGSTGDYEIKLTFDQASTNTVKAYYKVAALGFYP